jgi:hypothetical protein
MANKRFHFGANSVESIIKAGFNIVGFVQQVKVRAGFNSVCERTTWGHGNDKDEMIKICVRELIDQCMSTKGITTAVGMNSVHIKEDGTISASTFSLFALNKKGHLTAIPKDVAFAFVQRVSEDENIERIVRRSILNYDEIRTSVTMNELSLSEYLDQNKG